MLRHRRRKSAASGSCRQDYSTAHILAARRRINYQQGLGWTRCTPDSETPMRITRCTLVAVASLAFGATGGAQGTPNYHIAKKVVIGGEGGFDYVTPDPTSKRVLMAHRARACAYDLAKDTLVGEIPNTIGIHGVALAPDVGRGFT